MDPNGEAGALDAIGLGACTSKGGEESEGGIIPGGTDPMDELNPGCVPAVPIPESKGDAD